jgi:PAS domain S-box-containing protein
MSDTKQDLRQTPADAADLGKRAEAQAGAMEPISLSAQTPEAIQQMIHELRVRQIELEMENEALQHSLERFHIAQDMSPDGFTILRPVRDARERVVDFTWIYENPAIARLNGTDPEALVGRRLLELFPGHRGTPLMQAYVEVAESGETQIIETGYSGESMVKPAWFRIVVVPMAGDIAILAQDITERKQTEQQLRESEQKYRFMTEQMNDVVWISDLEMRVTYISPSDGRILGFTPEERAKHTLVDMLTPSSQEKAMEVISKEYALEEIGQADFSHSVTVELEYRHKDGSTRWLETLAKGIRDDKGLLIGFHGVSRDITDRKQAEKALRESEQRFKTIIQNLPGAVFAHDIEGRLLFVNKTASTYTGYSEQELLAMTVPDIDSGDFTKEDSHQLWHDLNVGESKTIQSTHTRKNGSKYPVEIHLNAISLDNQPVILPIVFDITERKRAEARELLVKDVLTVLNRPNNNKSIIRDILLLIKQQTGIEAVGLRLKEGEDFPYTQTNGFPDHFVELENHLCARDAAGRILRNDQGLPVLECMCGNVICGRTNPSLPFFTVAGSFWSNCTTDLLASTTEAERQANTRNRCNGEGYESVALIPLKAGDETIGLLQLNDHRRNQFTLDQITFLEGLGASIGIAITRTRTDEKLSESAQMIEGIINAMPVRVFWKDAQLAYLGCNASFARDAGFTDPKDLVGKDDFQMGWHEQAELYRADDRAVIESGRAKLLFEEPLTTPTGETITLLTSKLPLFNSQGKISGILGMYMDITERKKADNYRAMGVDVLKILYEPGDFSDIIERVIAMVKTRTGFDAVGLRLQDGEDFPYYAQDGFSTAFLLTENTLIERDKDGGVCRDKDGHACLECTCGLVISGKTDPTNPLFTRGGSFWTNDSFPLLDLPADQDPRLHPRNQCLRDGYASLALLPIRNKERIVGLLHLNDRRKGCFILETVELLEGIASHISTALMRKQAEEEQIKLQSQLVQAQKMESVGRLAGGVAHDYNNMLSVILGYTEMAMEQVDPDDPLYADLKEVFNAGKRSMEITGQLLAFARKQIISPVVMDLNETVDGMLKMLRRLIGEDIDFAWEPAMRLWPVDMDPSQIDQILANLCVNARDAITGVGKITIETENVCFDESYCAEHAGFIPGEFVMLAVSDNGCGMDKETLEHIFEPFFTTKEVGKGTGLGLATIYGIVKQNHGFINVYSEPGKGTTFRIYLPHHTIETDGATTEVTHGEVVFGQGETILLVEDEPAIIKMGQTMLKKLGYNVLIAHAPDEAVILASEHSGKIHILITDVIMPEMSGRDLADKLRAIRPDIRVLFMSGYTANVIAHHGVLDNGEHFMQKPFSMKKLSVKVREALEGAKSS